MLFKYAALPILAASVAFAPFSASAHGGHFHGRDFGLFAAGAAIVGVTAAIISAPFVALNTVAAQPYYAGPPAYYPTQTAYAPQPVYYSPPPPPVYYAPQPVYAPRYYSYR